ncbi:D-aminoacyl-tRNA deacylase [Octadecabacter sp. 1_MG-2023]|uniref:D-aminoacyl-tRNA deacylase n=1 Tax=unclassified Octadecabacter TaxID=196158 RepID=UPI001C09C56D|nr:MULTISPECIES: D-aminoacyl-tRNA deacylase [unclassified Octadecabacter]MBU2992698.1 D-tyrosyl-tRNA(Tyr) deacylase [Octadecabacter sp. B2R22]MDO6733851.1 D-aminoacyl-tRNA deacylase [Octadecabacter sp. 1_MG-2023]
MRALVQRVKSAQVHVDDALIGECAAGVLVLVCAMQGDTDDLPAKLAAKISKLRIFKDDDGRMNRSLADIGGQALVVSQFTLAADTSRGNRPGFSAAASPEDGNRLYEAFAAEMGALVPTQTGQFGADMAVSLVNDGPVTIWMDTDA